MKKKLLLLTGILVLCSNVFGASNPMGEQDVYGNEELVTKGTETRNENLTGLIQDRQIGEESSFTGTYFGELRMRNYQGPGRSDKVAKNSANKLEWTLAEGKLNMGDFGFAYSIDRDQNFDKDWNKQNEGWDTSFSLDYNLTTFEMLGKEWDFKPTINYQYDKIDTITSNAKDPSMGSTETKRRLSFNPKMSTTYNGFATDISPILAYDDIQGTVALQLDISMYRKLSDNWEVYGDIYFDFAGTKNDKVKNGTDVYTNSIFSGNIDSDNKFALSIEQYLKYTKELGMNFNFVNEFGLEAYSVLQSQSNDVALYTAPEVQYKGKIGNWTVVPYVKYIAYTATGWAENSYARDEFSTGVRFGMSF